MGRRKKSKGVRSRFRSVRLNAYFGKLSAKSQDWLIHVAKKRYEEEEERRAQKRAAYRACNIDEEDDVD